MRIARQAIPLSQTHWLMLVSARLWKHMLYRVSFFIIVVFFCTQFHARTYTRSHTHTTNNRPTNTPSVIEELHRFKNQHQIDASAELVDRNIKMVAFNFARQSNHPTFLKMMASIFELPKDKDMFIDKIRDILTEHNYKDVWSHAIFIDLPLEMLKCFKFTHFFYEPLKPLGLPNCTWLGIAWRFYHLWFYIPVVVARQNQHRRTVFGRGKIDAAAVHWAVGLVARSVIVNNEHLWSIHSVSMAATEY